MFLRLFALWFAAGAGKDGDIFKHKPRFNFGTLMRPWALQEQPARDYGALLLWPAEGGEVEVPPSSATRGHCTAVITATPWAQVRPWRSPNLLFCACLLHFPSS
ncbi:hypothetical protein Taro_009248 [Colocasia esculenta]|uniref:Secreted protein n=1 Tax=Colocasia esculenta TaxID=4460 RepID=A0A843U481_COLES|nr:hypothetical protein [Colocasia esculenta]